MKADEFYAVRSAVRSLADCTEKVIEAGGVRCRLSGMNSTLVSHRDVAFEGIRPRQDHAMTIRSARRVLIIGYTNYELALPDNGEGEFVLESVGGIVPTAILYPVLELVKEFLGVGWPAFPVILKVATLRVVKAWDETAGEMVPVRRPSECAPPEAGDSA